MVQAPHTPHFVGGGPMNVVIRNTFLELDDDAPPMPDLKTTKSEPWSATLLPIGKEGQAGVNAQAQGDRLLPTASNSGVGSFIGTSSADFYREPNIAQGLPPMIVGDFYREPESVSRGLTMKLSTKGGADNLLEPCKVLERDGGATSLTRICPGGTEAHNDDPPAFIDLTSVQTSFPDDAPPAVPSALAQLKTDDPWEQGAQYQLQASFPDDEPPARPSALAQLKTDDPWEQGARNPPQAQFPDDEPPAGPSALASLKTDDPWERGVGSDDRLAGRGLARCGPPVLLPQLVQVMPVHAAFLAPACTQGGQARSSGCQAAASQPTYTAAAGEGRPAPRATVPVVEPPPASRAPEPTLPLQRPQPQTLNVAFLASKGAWQITWTVDARKLKGNDRQAVSPTFSLQCGSQQVPFKMIIYPKPVVECRGGPSFKKARGCGYVQLKCEAEPAEGNGHLKFSLSVGSGDKADSRQNEHDFYGSAVCGLKKGQEEWDFNEVVEQDSQTFQVDLEVFMSPKRS